MSSDVIRIDGSADAWSDLILKIQNNYPELLQDGMVRTIREDLDGDFNALSSEPPIGSIVATSDGYINRRLVGGWYAIGCIDGDFEFDDWLYGWDEITPARLATKDDILKCFGFDDGSNGDIPPGDGVVIKIADGSVHVRHDGSWLCIYGSLAHLFGTWSDNAHLKLGAHVVSTKRVNEAQPRLERRKSNDWAQRVGVVVHDATDDVVVNLGANRWMCIGDGGMLRPGETTRVVTFPAYCVLPSFF